jgi:hypothetical protein
LRNHDNGNADLAQSAAMRRALCASATDAPCKRVDHHDSTGASRHLGGALR